jgi:hypothetical protein
MDENTVSHATAREASPPLVVALFGLTFVTGVIDAVSFLGLGHVFTALGVAGLAWYLYVLEPSTKRVDGVHVPLNRQTLTSRPRFARL